ncbi:MAG: zf-HC2 domain-containing protein [Treponema sp.]|jgi:hypothetical protein|nr:zf-HC2 domain-containing protein [Treponema sp.]
MCPDREVLSVYFDGELDSPWKEKLESHIGKCQSCKGTLERYRVIKDSLVPVDHAPAMERVWRRVEAGGTLRHTPFWGRSIRVPLPAAAAAGLVLALVSALMILRPPAVVEEPELQLATLGMDVQNLAPVQDMAGLIRYLGSSDGPDMVIINLPNTTFKSAGAPLMLRAADYTSSVIVPTLPEQK